ncbi:MAG TPA: ABC transporter permease [Thermomicrobiaceae bacterium]|nr:ABC transporter permease [Thermomicrobiaceae bacterium]
MHADTMDLALATPASGHTTSIGRKRWRAFARNKLAVLSLGFLVLVHVSAVLAPAIAPYRPDKTAPTAALRLPSGQHLLGTDEVGRDVLSRLLYGARISLVVGLAAVVISVVIGTLVGALSGFFSRWTDSVLMRFTDAMMAIPTFFLLLLILTMFGGSVGTIIVVIGVTSWMSIARLVRGEILRFSGMDFVTAARAIGATKWRILAAHVLPHAVSTIIVAASLGVANAILTESALSYLGLGVQPPTASWGNMLQNAQQYMFNAPLLSVYPGMLILLTVLGYNFLGDGLRDALDPHLLG